MRGAGGDCGYPRDLILDSQDFRLQSESESESEGVGSIAVKFPKPTALGTATVYIPHRLRFSLADLYLKYRLAAV